MVCFRTKSRDSAVGIVTSLRLDNRGTIVRLPTEARNFSLSEESTPVLVPIQPSLQRVLGIISAGVQRLVRAAEQLHLVST
jgi:hypothetical protein